MDNKTDTVNGISGDTQIAEMDTFQNLYSMHNNEKNYKHTYKTKCN